MVVAIIYETVGDAQIEIEKAVCIQDYIRESIKFGWASDFYDHTASDVRETASSVCLMSGTPFVAKLRTVVIIVE